MQKNKNNSGITAQYGFQFQKLAFILYMLLEVAPNKTFVYEGMDDIDVNNMIEHKDECVATCRCTGSFNIQVKSGSVTRAVWKRVVENWMLMDNRTAKVLMTENEVDDHFKGDDIVIEIYRDILSGKDKHKNSILNRVYRKFHDSEENQLKSIIRKTIRESKTETMSMQELKHKIDNNFISSYCSDIVIYDLAKKERAKFFRERCISRIDECIEQKNKSIFSYNDFMNIETIAKESISDHRYRIDIAKVRKRKQAEAKKIIKATTLREIEQLRYVHDDDTFIVKQLVNELFYKDFRNIYVGTIENIEISNIEDEAYTNYDDIKENLSFDGTCNSVNLYNKTIRIPLRSSPLLPGGPYSKGCYIFLTSENADENRRISWK